MLNCTEVANYFLSLASEDEGDLISNLKLQKLMYYAQGFHLAIFDEPLFPEPIEAWTYGPVVPVLYRHFKDQGSAALPTPRIEDFAIYSQDVRELLDEVYNVYGQFSAWKLADLTHGEPPWKDTALNCVISHDSMKEYFKTRLVA